MTKCAKCGKTTEVMVLVGDKMLCSKCDSLKTSTRNFQENASKLKELRRSLNSHETKQFNLKTPITGKNQKPVKKTKKDSR